ncbi:unnamed protein product [Linum tenue]|uniref:Non-haem dioxygenase N-terminal domain-containing protein n=1 Tax=Linum tenue TaxID=586396 RepID=A0AAV0N0G1_9ROSI|nr:unnamed protein product [Linum tenue]CAI0560788.1 unnamed protein product [Linum tenue]
MEDPELTKLGSSLQVACVQELAKNPIAAIPPRYLRPDQEPTNATSPLSIPVIDLQKLLSTSHQLDSLHAACRDWGFFQLMNHGVSESLIDKVKAEVEGFFNLPIEEKRKYWQRPGEMEGFGQAFVVSEEQKLDWGDLFYTTILPKHLRKPHLFPRLPLPLRFVAITSPLLGQGNIGRIFSSTQGAVNEHSRSNGGSSKDGHGRHESVVR